VLRNFAQTIPDFINGIDPTAIGWIEMPQRGSLLPYRSVLSFLSKAQEASGWKRLVIFSVYGLGCALFIGHFFSKRFGFQ
jgi:hypothetical protein